MGVRFAFTLTFVKRLKIKRFRYSQAFPRLR